MGGNAGLGLDPSRRMSAAASHKSQSVDEKVVRRGRPVDFNANGGAGDPGGNQVYASATLRMCKNL